MGENSSGTVGWLQLRYHGFEFDDKTSVIQMLNIPSHSFIASVDNASASGFGDNR